MDVKEALTRLGVIKAAPEGDEDKDMDQAAPTPRRGRRPRGNLFHAATILMVAVSLVAMSLFPSPALADEGYWKLVTPSSADAGNVDMSTLYHWFRRDDDQDVDLYESTGRDIYASDVNPSEPPADGTSWTMVSSARHSGDDSILGEWDPATKTFVDSEPPDALKEPIRALTHFLVTFLGGGLMMLVDLCVTLLGIVDVNRLLLSDFGSRGGTYLRFYEQTNSVVTKIATPLGTAFMTLAFVLYVIKLTDSRRYGGHAWFEALMRTIVFYLAATALVANSLSFSEVIYWAAKQTAEAVNTALSTSVHGGSTSLVVLGDNLEAAIAGHLSSITYDTVFYLIPVMVITFLSARQIVGFAITVFTTCFLRMVEIYLRAAFMPIPLSFLVNEDMRPIAVSYLKRFAGCCFMACVFIAALGLTNALADTVFGFFATVTRNLDGVAGMLASSAPVIITLSSLDAIIKKSNDIANSLFGI